MSEFTRTAKTLTTETLARIVAELTDEDGFTVSLSESMVVSDAENVGRSRVGDEQFAKMVAQHHQHLRQELHSIVNS